MLVLSFFLNYCIKYNIMFNICYTGVKQTRKGDGFMGIISVDFGHNSVKAATDVKDPIMIPSILTSNVKDIELSNLADYNPLDYLRIDVGGDEYMVGNLARKQSRLVIHNINDDDISTKETQILMLAAVGYLAANKEEINLCTDLPVTHYQKMKDDIKQVFTKDDVFRMKYYDYTTGFYEKKNFSIEEVDVKPQGFYALMDLILNKAGEIKPEMEKLASGLTVTIDIGFYSTDIYIAEGLHPRMFFPEKPIPGMAEAYRIINADISSHFDVRKELHQLEEGVLKKELKIKGKNYDITDSVEKAYKFLTKKIISEMKNNIPFTNDVDTFLLSGGGALALEDYFNKHIKGLKVIPNPQYANANGGLKWGQRTFKG